MVIFIYLHINTPVHCQHDVQNNMIKSLLHLLEEDNHQLTRNFQVVSIRQQNREEHFQKRRQASSISNLTQQTIVDPTLAPFINLYSQENFSPSQLFELIEEAQEEDVLRKHRAIIGVRKIINQLCINLPRCQSQQCPIILQFTRNGSLRVLVELCRMREFPQLVLESIWCLTNIVSISCIDWQALRECQVLEMLMELIKSDLQPEVYESVIISISNISVDQPSYRDYMLESGVIEAVINKIFIKSSEMSKNVVINSCWALSNLSRGHPLPRYQLVKEAVKYIACLLPYLIGTIALTDCLFVLVRHISIANNNLQEMIESEAVSTVIDAINTGKFSEKDVTVGIRILGNMSVGDQQVNQHMMSEGLTTVIEKGLRHSYTAARRDTCWLLSNLVVGGRHLTHQILANPLILPTLITIVKEDEIRTRKQACYFFANLTCTLDHAPYLQLIQRAELVENLNEILMHGDPHIVCAGLDCLRNILAFFAQADEDGWLQAFLRVWGRSGGGSVLQQLQYRQQREIYTKTSRIIKSYFEIQSEIEVPFDYHNKEPVATEPQEKPCSQ